MTNDPLSIIVVVSSELVPRSITSWSPIVNSAELLTFKVSSPMLVAPEITPVTGQYPQFGRLLGSFANGAFSVKRNGT